MIDYIRNLLIEEIFILSRHAFKRTIERSISIVDITEAGSNAEIIEEYPDDKYSPGCLVLGFTKNNRPLHIQLSDYTSKLLKIITVYEPDLMNWENDYRSRRK